jgi:hypothetical protein
VAKNLEICKQLCNLDYTFDKISRFATLLQLNSGKAVCSTAAFPLKLRTSQMLGTSSILDRNN